jgi:Methyltransferase domain
MSKLTKQQSALHAQACALLEKDELSEEDRLFVLEHWQESATHVNNVSGAFFTPIELARHLAIEVGGHRIIDLCAGIGSLAYAVYQRGAWSYGRPQITCVEVNPDYVAVGRKVLPEATWLVADILDLPASLAGFDCVIANPPFGQIKQSRKAPRYSGSEFEYKVIDVASDLARNGVFLLPQSSSPFQFSGRRSYEEILPDKYKRSSEDTSVDLECNCGIDTSFATESWRGVSIVTEIVLADFEEARARRQKKRQKWEQSSLFSLPGQRVA